MARAVALARDFGMAAFEDVVAITADWPATVVATSYGTPSVKVGSKSFCRMWSEREHTRDAVHDSAVLVVMCDIDEKPALIDASGGTLFSTPHYEGYGAMLVRLDNVEPTELAGYLEDAYRSKAGVRTLRAFDEMQG